MAVEEGEISLDAMPQGKVRKWFGGSADSTGSLEGNPRVGDRSERNAFVPKTIFTYCHISPKAGYVF